MDNLFEWELIVVVDFFTLYTAEVITMEAIDSPY